MSETERIRPHPADRLASPVQAIDLSAAARALRAEPTETVSGHRQIALARHGPLSVMLFAFEAGGDMKEHKADGEVVIHVLAGHMQVAVGNECHELSAGNLLSIAPGLLHSLHATKASEMLLTICRVASP
ncbi:MAG: cupin domain-containing protein [Phycisphaerae bacterium]|nr:cupin domain-containing protein [Phycisphaerae bacterium]